MPDLPVNSPEMMAFLKNEPPIQCDDVEAWVSCGTDRKVIHGKIFNFSSFAQRDFYFFSYYRHYALLFLCLKNGSLYEISLNCLIYFVFSLQMPWVCWIENSIIDRLGSITCDFVEILRPENDFEVEQSTRVRSKEFYELKKSDFLRAKCWTDDRE